MVKFTAKFAVDNPKGELAYHAFIKDLRERLAVGDPIKGVPILAPQVALGLGVLEFFDVDLLYNTNRVYLKLQTDNLSLIGYRPYDSTIWYELGPEDQETSLINEPGTTTEMLDFGSSYDDLYATGDQQLTDIQPSSATIGGAIEDLASTESDTSSTGSGTSDEDIACAVLMLKFAISEATKLRNVASFVRKSWSAGQDGLKPDAPLIAQVYSWARLSSAVQRVQNEGVEFIVDGQMTDIWTFEEAILALGIMHLPTNTASSSRLKRPITDMASTTPYARGQLLLEIFYFRINQIVQPQNSIYGKIDVTDSVGTETVLNTVTILKVVAGQDLVFVGPSRPLHAADELTIALNLLVSPTPDSEIKIKFDPFDYYAGAEYDVPIIRRVSQSWGSANMCYIAMTDGLYAKISVILIKQDEDIDEVLLYGDVSAHNGFGQTLLFHEASDRFHHMMRQHPIPLSKALVATPRDKTLRISVDLYHHINSYDFKQIAWGSVEFQPSYLRSESKRITGASGAVEVRVAWM